MIDFGKWAFSHRKLVYFLLAVLLVGGLKSALDMGKLEDPEIKVKIAMVVGIRPGASAHEMELEVTDPLEKTIRTLGDVSNVQSWSYNDLCIIQVELKSTTPDSRLEQCWDMLRHKVSDASASLPSGTTVRVQDDFGLVYGMFYALTADGFDERELADYATLLQRELTDIEGVARVELYGKQSKCINILLRADRMAALGISPTEVLATLNGQNGTFYAGYYDCGDQRVRVTVADRSRTVEQIREMIIQGHEDDQLRLGDIAAVESGYEYPVRNSMTRNGEHAIGIAVAGASGTDIVKVGKEVEQRLAELQQTRFPAGITCHKVFYQPERVTSALSTFFINLVESVVIVIVILMITMGFRSGMIIGFSLLTIVVGTFLLLGMTGGTMQRVSLASFILAMGMLVDNAIVIVDGILVALKEGVSRREAMCAIGRKTAMPLLGATVIAILAFLPVFLSPDTAGVYVRDLFIVLAASLLLSWILALVHVPLMANHLLKQPAHTTDSSQMYSSALYRHFGNLLRFGLRHRIAMLSTALALIGLSVWGYFHIRQGFFPDMVYDQLYIEYKLPEGTNSTRVAKDLQDMEAYLKTRPEVRNITASVGGTPARYNLVRSIALPSLSYGELIVDFDSPESLVANLDEIQRELSQRFPDAYVKVKRYNIMFKKYPIEVQFMGPDPAVLHRLADSAQMIMKRCPEVAQITTGWEPSVPVWVADYDQMSARRSHLSRQDIATSLMTAEGGIPVGTFYEGIHSNKIYLKCTSADGTSIDNPANVPVFPLLPNVDALLDDDLAMSLSSGMLTKGDIMQRLRQTKPLGQVGHGVDVQWEDPVVLRYNGQRMQNVMCSPAPGIETERARKAVAESIEALELPVGYSLRWDGEKAASEQTMYWLFKQVPLAIVLIIAVLIMLFGDYRKPTIILCCIPLLAVGVVGAMLMTGKTFDFCAIVGALGLMGMLIKNCIVLLDEIVEQCANNDNPVEALVVSAQSRLRPVMMASLTTILGMIPLLSDAMFGSMATTIMGGLFFSTIATLLFLPVLYALLFGIKAK